MRTQRQRGLSLIEIGVVLVIIGLALAAAAPSMVDWFRDLAVRNAAESVKAGLERARVESLRRNARVGFWLVNDSTGKSLTNACVLSSSGPSWVVASTSPEGLCAATPSLTVAPMLVDRWAASEGASRVRVQAVDIDGTASNGLSFNSLGQASTVAGQISRVVFNHETDKSGASPRLEVRVEAGGGVRMCDPTADANNPRRC